jgi:hypothetical protein
MAPLSCRTPVSGPHFDFGEIIADYGRVQAVMRSFLSALTAAVLLVAVASGECISCPTSVSPSSRKGNCCTKDGRCNAFDHKSHPDQCLKAHDTEVALVKQCIQVHPEITSSTLDVTERIAPALISQIQASVPLGCDYSPPEPYLLNSVFLI